MKDFINRYSKEKVTHIQLAFSKVVEHWRTQKAALPKQWGRNEFLTLFALAFVLGLACKAVSIQFLTIGYEDYTLTHPAALTTLPPIETLPEGPLCQE